MPQQQYQQHDPNVRFAAQSLYDNIGAMQYSQYYRGPGYQSSMDMTRSHSINLITEEYLSGYMQDGRMSIVRRFFCLFVTFDLVFISLLWLICILITGDDIYDALKFQILHYSIYTSVFDIVMAAICRFVVLILFYAFLYVNHWLIIALSTSGSCMFLISKVFVYNWIAAKQPVFEVVLIVVSFILAWGQAWFLDCRVIPQERHARHYFTAITSDRSPLLAPFLSADTVTGGSSQQPESAANFYSPYDTTHNSDDEDEQDDEYRKMGNECVRKAYELLQSGDWKAEKVTKKGDTIQSKNYEKLGKIYRLTARVKYPAKALLEELFYKVEEIPKWNPTLLDSKVVRKIDTHTDVTYQATASAGGGIVKSRDFVNLRCWRPCRDGKVIESDDDDEQNYDPNDSYQPSTAEGSISTISDNEYLQEIRADSFVKKSASEQAGIDEKLTTTPVGGRSGSSIRNAFQTLSKSLGARDFQVQVDSETPPPLDDEYSDALDNLAENISKTNKQQKNDVGGNPELTSEKFTDKIYISSALSIEYEAVPNNSKYIRGQNLVSCWAMREIEGKSDVCIFEWIMCLDLKGYIPRLVLDQAYTSLMQDYMTFLRKHCKELREKRKKVPKINY